MMKLSTAFKAVAAVALATVAAAPVGYAGLRFERANNRYATCLAQNTGGKAGIYTITDMEGRTAASLPLYRTYGLEKLGVRAGVIVHAQTGKDDLALTLKRTKDGFRGHWDFVRVAGKPIPTGTAGQGNPVPDAAQSAVGAYAEFCANSTWVKGPQNLP